MRKFTLWFDANNHYKNYFKMDVSIFDEDGVAYPISIMVRADNPYRLEIIQEFDRMILGYLK